MEKNTFYGTAKLSAISYLEFGSLDLNAGKKNIWDFRLHDKAYDWLMHARYSNDIAAYLEMKEEIEVNSWNKIFEIYNTEIHHNDDASGNLAKVLALMNIRMNEPEKQLSFFEIGQTLFGCIDGMEFYQSLLEKISIDIQNISLKDIKWYGVDISPFFNRLAKVIHQSYNIETMLTLDQMKDEADVFFAKGITLLYACNSIDSFFEVIGKAQFGLFDYSFSLNDLQEVIIGTGKSVLYLSYKDFKSEYTQRGKKLYVKANKAKIDKENGRVWVDCIYGDQKLIDSYISLDLNVRTNVHTHLSLYKGSSRLLNDDSNPRWMEIDEFINDINLVN